MTVTAEKNKEKSCKVEKEEFKMKSAKLKIESQRLNNKY